MRRAMNRLLLVVLLSLCGCVKNLPYSSTRVSGDHVAALQRLMDMASISQCLTRGIATKESVKFQVACANGALSWSTSVSSIKSIKLQTYASYYRVLVTHTTDRPDFAFITNALDDAENFANHLTALRAARFEPRASATDL